MRKTMSLFLIFLIIGTSFVVVSSLPQASGSAPSGIIYQVPINIDNTQTSATPNPFQQMVNISISTFSSYIYDNNTSANFEFYYSNGTVIPAWIESVSGTTITVWLKLYSIPASTTITIYLGFASKSTNLLSSSGTTGIGEAPQLSKTYAQYDDGASVFNNYWNFAGTTLPSGWRVVSGTAGTDYKINNGLQLLTTTARLQGTNLTQNFILEGYFQFISNAYNGWDFGIFSSSSSAYSMHPDGNGTSNNWTGTWYYNNGYVLILKSGVTIGSGYYFLWQIINNAGSITTNFDTPSYSTLYTASFTNSLSGAPITVGERFDNAITGQALNVIFYYIRVRAYPPNGVMPSTSFGSIVQYQTTYSPTIAYITPQNTGIVYFNFAIQNTSSSAIVFQVYNKTNGYYVINESIPTGAIIPVKAYDNNLILNQQYEYEITYNSNLAFYTYLVRETL